MNGRTAKLLRSAAGYPRREPRPATEYEPLALHRVYQFPLYEEYVRVIRAWGPKLQRYTTRTVEKIRYRADGKTPFRLILNKEGLPETYPVPCAKPIRLKAGALRRGYKMLKRLHRRVGLDAVFQQLTKEASR